MLYQFRAKVIQLDKKTVTIRGGYTSLAELPEVKREVGNMILRFLPGCVLDVTAPEFLRLKVIGAK